MGIFGWSLPPGCSSVPGDEPTFCEVCGMVDDCICPECPICHEHGNPKCYDKNGHGMEKNAAQQIEYQKYRVAEAKATWQDECQILDYLEYKWNRQGD